MVKNRQITFGIFLSYLQIAIGAIITLLYTPFIIRILGQSEYGLYNTVSSVIASLSILSLGFGSSYVRFFSKYKAEKTTDSINKLNGMFLVIFIVIGVIALICGTYLSFNLKFVFADGLTVMELDTARILMLLLTINLSISFPGSVFTSIVTAHEKFVFQKTILLIKQIASPLISIPVLLLGYGSVGMVICTVIISLVGDFVTCMFCVKKLKTRFSLGHFDKLVFKELFVYSSFIAINMIVDQINLNIDKFLLARYRGTASVAVYSAGFTLYHYYLTFSTSISNVFTPQIHRIWNDISLDETEKNRKLTHMFIDVGRIQFFILLLVCSGLIFFGKQFIRIWAGNGYENAYWVVLLLAISAIIPLSQNIGIEVQRAKNKHRFRSILYLCMAFVNLAISIYLCQIYGEIGSAIGTAISFIVVNTIIMNLYYQKSLQIDIVRYWKMIVSMFTRLLPAFVCGVCIYVLMDTTQLMQLLVAIIFYSLIYCALGWIFIVKHEEKQAILLKLRR